MASTDFMMKKFSIPTLVDHYLKDIEALKPLVKSPQEESHLQGFAQAAGTFKKVTIMDIIRFAMSYGRGGEGKSEQMRQSLNILLGNRVNQLLPIDVAYLKLLLAYTQSFKFSKQNLEPWMLRFVLSSRFSPVLGFVDAQLHKVIADTQMRIRT